MPNIMRTRQEEIDYIISLMAASQELNRGTEVIEKRLKSIENGYADFQLIQTKLNDLIDKLFDTLPTAKLQSIQGMMKYMSYQVHYNALRHVENSKGLTAVQNDQLKALTVAAHEQCKICFNHNCRACEIGKVLDKVLSYDRRENESWFDY